jgi:hypothetical protein
VLNCTDGAKYTTQLAERQTGGKENGGILGLAFGIRIETRQHVLRAVTKNLSLAAVYVVAKSRIPPLSQANPAVHVNP